MFCFGCYFLYNNLIWKSNNSGPIGLLILFVFSERYLQRLEEISIVLSFAKTFKRYIDYGHPTFENKQKSLQFFETLNKQDPSVQFAIEFGNNLKQLDFKDTIIINNEKYFLGL